jgi:hypothetical protein
LRFDCVAAKNFSGKIGGQTLLWLAALAQFSLLAGGFQHGPIVPRVNIGQISHKSDDLPDLIVGVDFLESRQLQRRL